MGHGNGGTVLLVPEDTESKRVRIAVKMELLDREFAAPLNRGILTGGLSKCSEEPSITAGSKSLVDQVSSQTPSVHEKQYTKDLVPV